jgi:hypothetical protein
MLYAKCVGSFVVRKVCGIRLLFKKYVGRFVVENQFPGTQQRKDRDGT